MLKDHVKFVIDELRRHNINYVGTKSGRGRRGTTILVETTINNKKVEKVVKIKKSQINHDGEYWLLNDIGVTTFAEDNNNVYIFIDKLNNLHIVPSKAVKVALDMGHNTWLKYPSKSGKVHRDSTLRHYKEPSGIYINNFEEFRK